MSIGLLPTCSVRGNGSTARQTSRNEYASPWLPQDRSRDTAVPHRGRSRDITRIQSGRRRDADGRQSGRRRGAIGTRPRLEFRDIDYQLVIKSSVETQPKNVGVSTLSLKRYLIISGLQISPWPRPACGLGETLETLTQ